MRAVHDRLAREGAFTAEAVAADVGCTPGTFWSHFGTKDDAITEAFAATLEDLVALNAELWGDGPGGFGTSGPEQRTEWAAAAIDRMIEFFTARALVFRAAMARLAEHRELRTVYRRAERHAIDDVARALGPDRPPDDAALVIAFCQGLNNPTLLASATTERARRRLAQALLGFIEPDPG